MGALILRLSELKRRNKKIGLINTHEGLENMLDIFKCRDFFLIFDSEEDALQSLG